MHILSRHDLLILVTKERKQHCPIIIHEYGRYNDVIDIVDNCKDALVLEMDDTITERQGSPTKELVEKALSSNFEIVSCRAGISRSSAIAYLLACKRTSPEEAIQLLLPSKHFPNELILKYGMEILGEQIFAPIAAFYKQVADYRGWQLKSVTKYFAPIESINWTDITDMDSSL